MAKKTESTMSDEGKGIASDIGQGEITNLPGKVAAFDAFESVPTFVPGKNLEEGMTLRGRFKLTKRVYSEKFQGNKRDESGRKYRDLHVLTDSKGRDYGIWSVGKLGAAMGHLVQGDYIEVTYEGRDEKPLKEGNSPAHNFSFKGVSVTGAPLVADWNADEEDLPVGTGVRLNSDAVQASASA